MIILKLTLTTFFDCFVSAQCTLSSWPEPYSSEYSMLIFAAGRVLCRLFPSVGGAASRTRTACGQFLEQRELDDPSLLLQIVAGFGALAFAALAFYRWNDATIFAMFIDDAPAERFVPLQPDNAPLYDFFSRMVELLLFTYGLAAYVVYSHARRIGARIPQVTTMYVLAVPALALLLMRALPYRIVYQNESERVDYGDMRCYDIGRRPGMIKLFCPEESPPRNKDVEDADPALHDRHISESVFTPRDQARVFATTPP